MKTKHEIETQFGSLRKLAGNEVIKQGDWLQFRPGGNYEAAKGCIGDEASTLNVVYRPSSWHSLLAGDLPPATDQEILVCSNNDKRNIAWFIARAVRGLAPRYASFTHWLDPGDPVAQQPSIQIGEYKVTINPGESVTVGCTTVDVKTVDEIHKRLHENS